MKWQTLWRGWDGGGGGCLKCHQSAAFFFIGPAAPYRIVSGSHHQSPPPTPPGVYCKPQLYNCPRGEVTHFCDSPAKFLTGATVVAC